MKKNITEDKIKERFLTTLKIIPLLYIEERLLFTQVAEKIGLSNYILRQALFGNIKVPAKLATCREALSLLNIDYDAYLANDVDNIFIKGIEKITLPDSVSLINFLAFHYSLSLATFFDDFLDKNLVGQYRDTAKSGGLPDSLDIDYLIERVNEHPEYAIEKFKDGTYLVLIDKTWKLKQAPLECTKSKEQINRERNMINAAFDNGALISLLWKCREIALNNKFIANNEECTSKVKELLKEFEESVKRNSIREWDKVEFKNKLGTLAQSSNERDNFFNRKYRIDGFGVCRLASGSMTPSDCLNDTTVFLFESEERKGTTKLSDIYDKISIGAMIPLKRENEQ